MNEVDELISIYVTMSPDGRDRLRSMAKHMQRRFPLQNRPMLSLVKNADDVKPLNHIIDSRVDYSSIRGIGEAVNSK